MGELLLPGILYAAPLEEEDYDLHRMGFHTFSCPPSDVIHMRFGCDGNWLDLADLIPFDCDDGEKGYEIVCRCGDRKPYRVGNGILGPAHHRLIFAIRHVIAFTDVWIAEHMDANPVELPED